MRQYPEQVGRERPLDILRRAIALVEERLPEGWTTELTGRAPADAGVDALLSVRSPDGTSATLAIQSKVLFDPRELPLTVQHLAAAARDAGLSTAVPMVTARYLSESAREQLVQRGAAYADATGNIRIVLSRPGLFVSDVGASSDPWRRRGRPADTLSSPAAARVVRALIDFSPPYTALDVVHRSGASVGATYRVLDYLVREALVERAPRGAIIEVAWRRLIERWSRDYGFQRSNAVQAFLHPRGLATLLSALRSEKDLTYVLTGSLAAERLAPHAPPRLAMVYVDDVDAARRTLDLRPVDAGANTLLAVGPYDVVFERARVIDGLRIAGPSQVAVDLLTGPGRSPAEAEALIHWMEANERDWRS